MRLKRPLVFSVLAGVLWTGAVGSGVVAQENPYAEDPLGLVAFRDTVTTAYTGGTDLLEVWVCDPADGALSVDPVSVAQLLNSEITPYYEWLSGGRYRPLFRSGGIVQTAISDPPRPWLGGEFDGCETQVAAATAGGIDGVVIVVADDYTGGYATPGVVCPGGGPFCPTTYPDNFRAAFVGGGSVTAVPPFAQPHLATVAHEIGHTLSWPHSFSGESTSEGFVFEYDNPMDIMSGGEMVGIGAATIAINRYAAGWLNATGAAFHRSGVFTYELAAPGGGPTQFLVLPNDSGSGRFDVLGVRIAAGYDAGLPKTGIEVYSVDQSITACDRLWPGYSIAPDLPCFGQDRRTQQSPAVAGYSSAHVHGPGEVFTVRGVEIEVLGFTGNSFTLRVNGAAVSERFVDDNGNPHETNIETIASVGVTLGCNPPINDRYCPTGTVSRAEMAAFILRSIGEDQNIATYRGLFPDVPAGQWYSGYVERLYDLGLTTGYPDGTFQPNREVTRAEMAAFLIRALGEEGGLIGPRQLFQDVASGAWYGPYAERLFDLGITTGCAVDPRLYCPDAPVKRDQMGSFVARTLPLVP